MLICPACSRKYVDGLDQCSEDGTQLVRDTSRPTLAAGTALEGGFTIQQMIGAGPTGEVYRAEKDGHMVAIKLLSPELATDQGFTKHMARLLSHLVKVRHPGVAAHYSSGWSFFQGRPWLVRDMAVGQSLTTLVRHLGPLGVRRAIPIAMGVAEALTEAHRAGALHLNLKPSNVFIDERDKVKLVDFGIGQRVELEGGTIHGDPRFMAPEQFEGQLVSFRSDIYGLGALLFYLLTARPPFQGAGADLIYAVRAQNAPLASSLEPSLAGMNKLDQVVARSLEKTPAKRHLSVQHFGRMMDGILQEHTLGNQAAPQSSRTLPYGAQPPGARQDGGPHWPPAPGSDDTVRMQAPPDDDIGNVPTSREASPFYQSQDASPTVEVQQQPYESSEGSGRHRLAADTVRMAVAPAPQRPSDTQPLSVAPMEQAPTSPVVLGSDDVDIDIVTEAPAPPPRRKRKKKKKKRDPIVAVRGEAALRLGPSGEDTAANDENPGQAVLVEESFLQEARGPERNLATMEIRVPPEYQQQDEAVPQSTVPRQKRKKKTNPLKVVLIILGLIVLFVVAAFGAAALASSYLRQSQPAPQGAPSDAPPISPAAE